VCQNILVLEYQELISMSAGGFSLRSLFFVDDETPKGKSALERTPNPTADRDSQFGNMPSFNPSAADPLPPLASAPATASSPVPPLSTNIEPVSGVDIDPDLVMPEGVDLTTIYTQASIPTASFPIEKLAKLVDGMKQFDAATKKIAVTAIASADENWDIATVVADGKIKRTALVAYQGKVTDLERAINEEITQRLEANQADKAARLGDIDRQIAALQSQREAMITESSNAAAGLRTQGLAATQAADRERHRIDNSIRGFDDLIALFDTTTPSSSV
jgi:hypothetical protein